MVALRKDEGDAQQREQQLEPLHEVVEKKGFHEAVGVVVVAMMDDAGEWWPKGMPIERVAVVRAAVADAVADGSFEKCVKDLENLAVAVGKKPRGKMVGAHLALLLEEIVDSRKPKQASAAKSNGVDGDRERRARALLGLGR